jgi:hypothetical protein
LANDAATLPFLVRPQQRIVVRAQTEFVSQSRHWEREGAQAMLEKLPAIVASGFVLMFVADLIGNFITFTSKWANAVVTCVIWGILFFALDMFYYYYLPPPLLPEGWLLPLTLIGVALAFIAALLGNYFLFDRRYANAFVTGIVWSVLFAIVYYVSLIYFEMA